MSRKPIVLLLCLFACAACQPVAPTLTAPDSGAQIRAPRADAALGEPDAFTILPNEFARALPRVRA